MGVPALPRRPAGGCIGNQADVAAHGTPLASALRPRLPCYVPISTRWDHAAPSGPSPALARARACAAPVARLAQAAAARPHLRRMQCPAEHPVNRPKGSEADAESVFLAAVGARLRTLRARRGTTRRDLAARSGVSERTIAQLESGEGNISILLLRRLARALGLEPADLLQADAERSAARVLMEQMVAALPDTELAEARNLLAQRFGNAPLAGRADRIALIGLRGAGKSTLGRLLADHARIPFIELDREVEREGGMELADIFALHGQEGFRRLERTALARVVRDEARAVIAAGGGIVAESATYALLLDGCTTVWVKATPEEHMARVVAQGDLRPMHDNRGAMADLRAILASREALYARADVTLDTSGRTPAASLEALLLELHALQSSVLPDA